MDLDNKSVLILGGSGLVGSAIARRLLSFGPSKIVLVSLYEDEVRRAAESLEPERGDTQIAYEWGNVFLPADAAGLSREQLLTDEGARQAVIADLLDDLSPELLGRSLLYRLVQKYRPHAVVDCINTATAFAYQDVFTSARDLLELSHGEGVSNEVAAQPVLTLTMPQLIRHMQIVVEATRAVGTQAYVKIGTSGTGGMGFNIPYTHSEERPSRTLLTKAAVAGAHSLLLFLMARTPGAPAVIEIKPTAAIAWRRIAFGPVPRWGRPLPRFDCPDPMRLETAFDDGPGGWIDLGRPVEAAYIDVGENGVFAKEEFETVSAHGQMEFITPEEVAEYTVMELVGRSSGRDIVAALDSATAGPTYSAGVMRSAALSRLEALEAEHGVRSVAFEMLGPPRVSKMLYEAFVWSRLRPTVRALGESDAAGLAAEAEALMVEDEDLRSLIVSIGLPILVQDGKVYRASKVILPPKGPSERDIDLVASRGWVDLRPASCEKWIGRARTIVEQAEARARNPGSGSGLDWAALGADDAIAPARFVKWVFRFEDDGERIKR
jgi:NAD(P)-dependent dehydrogenase (short-subunit alcohol dehydrogenase family)